ncbi:hypothetical protein ED236_05790 [Pseudomethylobacillus aquaticus]|uniref:Uncharacterized protein n=1 Tax=Pseudomethylobacillus aquaticus TaxID=2676064 RepID=A0A3N0V3Q7_9PROT|nr:hypothetical protein ED236_05790 [Pseudomethylobacillus aquaticus]
MLDRSVIPAQAGIQAFITAAKLACVLLVKYPQIPSELDSRLRGNDGRNVIARHLLAMRRRCGALHSATLCSATLCSAMHHGAGRLFAEPLSFAHLSGNHCL